MVAKIRTLAIAVVGAFFTTIGSIALIEGPLSVYRTMMEHGDNPWVGGHPLFMMALFALPGGVIAILGIAFLRLAVKQKKASTRNSQLSRTLEE